MFTMTLRRYSYCYHALLIVVLVYTGKTAATTGTETLIGITGRDFVLLGADTATTSPSSVAWTVRNVDKLYVISNAHGPQQPAIVTGIVGDAADADRVVNMLQAHARLQEYEASVGGDVHVLDCHPKCGRAPLLPPPPATAGGLAAVNVAHFAREMIVEQLRSPTPLRVCMLVAGVVKPSASATATPLSPTEAPAVSLLQSQVQQATLPFLVPVGAATIENGDSGQNDRISDVTTTPQLFWLDEYGALQSVPYAAHGYGSMLISSILDRSYDTNLSRQEAYDVLQSCFAQLRSRYVLDSHDAPCIKCVDRGGCRTIWSENDL